jgi:predicted CopG family antitoxin
MAQDRQFALDQVNTSLTAPNQSFQAQQGPNTQILNQSINKGVGSLTNALGIFAVDRRQKEVEAEVQFSKLAAARGEVMPGFNSDAAEKAYHDTINTKALSAASLAVDDLNKGPQFKAILDSTDVNDIDKMKQYSEVVGKIMDTAAQSITDGEVYNKLVFMKSSAEDSFARLLAVQTRDRKQIDLHHYVKEDVNRQLNFNTQESLDFDITFDTKLIDTAKHLQASAAGYNYEEAVQATLAAMMGSEMTSDQLIKMMSKPINSRGITGNDLAHNDATFRSIFNRALSDRKAEHTAVAARDKEIVIEKKSKAVDIAMSALVSDPDMSDEDVAKSYTSNGGFFDKAGQRSTFVDNIRKDAAGLGKGFASPEARQLKHLIAVSSGNFDEAEIKSTMIDLGIASNTLPQFTKLNGTEKTQFKEALTYINSTNIASKKIFSIIGKSLKPESSKAIFAKLAGGEPFSEQDLNELKESMILNAVGVANGVTAKQLTEALVVAQLTLAKINKLATDTAADAAINNIRPSDINLTPFAAEVEGDIEDLLEIINGGIKGKTSAETSSQGTPSSPTVPQEKSKVPETKKAEGEPKVTPIVKIPSILEQSIKQTELRKRITDSRPLFGLITKPRPLDEQKYLETIVPTKIDKSAYERVVEHHMALVEPIMGSMDALVKFAGGAVDGLGKVVGGATDDIRSAVNSFLDGPQISNALKDFDPIDGLGKLVGGATDGLGKVVGGSIEDIGSAFNSFMKGPQISNAVKDIGSNSESFFKDAMITILERVNAVAGAISSDAEGSTLARGQVPQLRKPNLIFPETGVNALADVTSRILSENKICRGFKVTQKWDYT